MIKELNIKCALAVMETNHILGCMNKSIPVKGSDPSFLFGTCEASLWSQERQVSLTGKES